MANSEKDMLEIEKDHGEDYVLADEPNYKNQELIILLGIDCLISIIIKTSLDDCAGELPKLR